MSKNFQEIYIFLPTIFRCQCVNIILGHFNYATRSQFFFFFFFTRKAAKSPRWCASHVNARQLNRNQAPYIISKQIDEFLIILYWGKFHQYGIEVPGVRMSHGPLPTWCAPPKHRLLIMCGAADCDTWQLIVEQVRAGHLWWRPYLISILLHRKQLKTTVPDPNIFQIFFWLIIGEPFKMPLLWNSRC